MIAGCNAYAIEDAEETSSWVSRGNWAGHHAISPPECGIRGGISPSAPSTTTFSSSTFISYSSSIQRIQHLVVSRTASPRSTLVEQILDAHPRPTIVPAGSRSRRRSRRRRRRMVMRLRWRRGIGRTSRRQHQRRMQPSIRIPAVRTIPGRATSSIEGDMLRRGPAGIDIIPRWCARRRWRRMLRVRVGRLIGCRRRGRRSRRAMLLIILGRGSSSTRQSTRSAHHRRQRRRVRVMLSSTIALGGRVIGRLTIGRLGRVRGQRLSMRAVDDRWTLAVDTSTAGTDGAASGSSSTRPRRVAQMRIGRVRGDKGLRLRRDRGKDALLIEALAVAASSVFRALEAGAADLFDYPHASALPVPWILIPPHRVVIIFFDSPCVDDSTDRRSPSVVAAPAG